MFILIVFVIQTGILRHKHYFSKGMWIRNGPIFAESTHLRNACETFTLHRAFGAFYRGMYIVSPSTSNYTDFTMSRTSRSRVYPNELAFIFSLFTRKCVYNKLG